MAGVPVLAALSDKAALSLPASLLPFGPGEAVVSEGEEGVPALCHSQRGLRGPQRRRPGKEHPCGPHQKGDFFGEMSLLTGAKTLGHGADGGKTAS